LNTLLYHIGDFFGVTTDAHPHSGWLIGSHLREPA